MVFSPPPPLSNATSSQLHIEVHHTAFTNRLLNTSKLHGFHVFSLLYYHSLYFQMRVSINGAGSPPPPAVMAIIPLLRRCRQKFKTFSPLFRHIPLRCKHAERVLTELIYSQLVVFLVILFIPWYSFFFPLYLCTRYWLFMMTLAYPTSPLTFKEL